MFVFVIFLVVFLSVHVYALISYGILPEEPDYRQPIKCFTFFKLSDMIENVEFEWRIMNETVENRKYYVNSNVGYIYDILNAPIMPMDSVTCILKLKGKQRIEQFSKTITVKDADVRDPLVNITIYTLKNDTGCTARISDKDGDINSIALGWKINGNIVREKNYTYNKKGMVIQERLSELLADEDEIECYARVCDTFTCIENFDKLYFTQYDKKPVVVSYVNNLGNGNVFFDLSSSYDEDGFITFYRVDFGDGTETGWRRDSVFYHKYRPGIYNITFTVIDNNGNIGMDSVLVEIGYVDHKYEVCDIEIKEVKYTKFFEKGRLIVKGKVKNYGVNTTVSIYMIMKGSNYSITDFFLGNGEEKRFARLFYGGVGEKKLRIIAHAVCNDTDEVEISVYGSDILVEKVGEKKEKIEFKFRVLNNKTKTEVNRSVRIEFTIFGTDENISIDVHGVPKDWLSYEKRILVNGRRNGYIEVLPKNTGNYTLKIIVRRNNTVTTRYVILHVVEREDTKDGFDIFKVVVNFLQFLTSRILRII